MLTNPDARPSPEAVLVGAPQGQCASRNRGPVRVCARRLLALAVPVLVLASCSDGTETSTCYNYLGGVRCTYENESALGRFWEDYQGWILLGGGVLAWAAFGVIGGEMDKRKVERESRQSSVSAPMARPVLSSGERWVQADQVKVGDVLVSATSAQPVMSIHGDPANPARLGFILADGSWVVVDRGQRVCVW